MKKRIHRRARAYWEQQERIEMLIDRAIGEDRTARDIYFRALENIITTQNKIERGENGRRTKGKS